MGSCLAESTTDALKNQADSLREEGKSLEALNLYNQALVSYQHANNYEGVLNTLAGRLISWQHLYNHDQEYVYAILARKEAEAMLAVAQEYKIHNKDYLIHFLYGKSCIFLKDYPCAEKEYRMAVELYTQDNAEKGDLLAHLGEALYLNGQKQQGEKMILDAIQQILSHQEGNDSFKINVWTSGAYLRLAKVLFLDGKLEQAVSYFKKGEEIVLKDPRLVIRNQQLDIIKKKFIQ
jgi:tetratricopeptide (TPR) repeat protein